VRSSGRSAWSKWRASARAARCTCKQRQESLTRIVVSYDVLRPLAIRTYCILTQNVDINVLWEN
jgi:hypothetical protein